MAGNALARYVQAGGSPYDEEDYMQDGRTAANEFLNSRLDKRLHPVVMDYILGGQKGFGSDGMGYHPRSRFDDRGGTDMDMMRIYGPEDEVAYDNIGRPIPLNDPRHPRNQTPGNALAYPQRR